MSTRLATARGWLRSKRIVGLLLAVTVAGIASVAFGTGAFAYSYDGTDPQQTVCHNDAYSPRSQNINFAGGPGTLEQRFSSNCQTSWARFTCTNHYGCGNYFLYIQRSDRTTYSVTVNGFNQSYGSNRWTRQLWDGEGVFAQVCLEDLSNGHFQCLISF